MDRKAKILAIINDKNLDQNPAAKVSKIFRLMDVDMQRTLILYFATHMVEVVDGLSETDMDICQTVLETTMRYLGGRTNIEDVAASELKLHEYQAGLRQKSDKTSEYLIEFVGLIKGTISICCGEALHNAGFRIRNKPRPDKFIGYTAYGMAKIIGNLLYIKNNANAQAITSNECHWQIEQILKRTNL